MTVKRTEAEVAAVVMQHFIDDGWDCYPEVEVPYGRCDIVAVRPFPFMPKRKCVHIIECKNTWSLTLLEQAWYRTGLAHYVTVAAPSAPRFFYERLCKERGIGMLKFTKSYDLTVDLYNSRLGSMHRNKTGASDHGPGHTLSLLDDDMKRYAPGTTAASGYSTPWRRTMDRAAGYVADNPGCTVKDILANVEHHYASGAGARQGILIWLQKRDDVEVRKEGRALRFYPPGARSIEPSLFSTQPGGT